MRINWIEAEIEGTGQICFVSEWDGHETLVTKEEEMWRVWVDGKRVKGAWHTARAAQDATRDAIDKAIAERARSGVYVARQGTPRFPFVRCEAAYV